MISMLIMDENVREATGLKEIVKELAARLTEESWKIYEFTKREEIEQLLKEHPILDMSCFDVTPQGAIDNLREFRKEYMQTGLILIADSTVSPLSYLKPGIKADSLLIRPLTRRMVYQSMEEFFLSCMREREGQDQKAFVIGNKAGKTYLPYQDIFYFEAREKRIFARTLNEEYGFYYSLENLMDELPENYLRCHRSYIVNRSKIEKVISGQNRILLRHGFDIPLSRSYRSQLMQGKGRSYGGN